VILKLAGQEQDPDIKALASEALKTLFAPTAYSRAEVEQIQKLCECHLASSLGQPTVDGRLRLTARVGGNGCVFLKVEPSDRNGEPNKSSR
jgi:hypothetical protein